MFHKNKKNYIITLTDSFNIHSIFEQCVFDIIASHRERSGVVARRERTRDDRRFENLVGTRSSRRSSHCLDLDLNGKRPGITSDGSLVHMYLIGRSWYNHFRSFSMGGNEGLHKQGMANQANQPIFEKLPKWHFLTQAYNYFFLKFLFDVAKNISFWNLLIPSMWLFRWIKVDK